MHACDDDTKTSLFYIYYAKNMKLQLLRVCRLQFLALFYRFIYRNTQISNKSKRFFKRLILIHLLKHALSKIFPF